MVHLQKGKIVLSGNLILNEGKLLLLFRNDHKHWETPGGKVNFDECVGEEPSLEELQKVAVRELYEEVKGVEIVSMDFFGNVHFTVPDGREAIANKFVVRIKGNAEIGEPELFSKLEWIDIGALDHLPISPDLRLFLPKLDSLV